MGPSDSRSRRTPFAASVLAVTLGLAASACSSASATGTSSSTEPVATAPPATTATYDYGNARSGRDTVDPKIANLSSKPVWDDSLDGGVYGQPLVYNGSAYVGTENDTIYSLSATTGKVLWHLHVGTAVSTSVIDSAQAPMN